MGRAEGTGVRCTGPGPQHLTPLAPTEHGICSNHSSGQDGRPRGNCGSSLTNILATTSSSRAALLLGSANYGNSAFGNDTQDGPHG